MRISDWSSDVCSSDLEHLDRIFAGVDHRLDREEHAGFQFGAGAGAPGVDDLGRVVEHLPDAMAAAIAHHRIAMPLGMRSEERRGGKACVSTCSSRWWRYT